MIDALIKFQLKIYELDFISTVCTFSSSVRSEAIKYDNMPLKSGGLTKAGMRLVRSSSPLH